MLDGITLAAMMGHCTWTCSIRSLHAATMRFRVDASEDRIASGTQLHVWQWQARKKVAREDWERRLLAELQMQRQAEEQHNFCKPCKRHQSMPYFLFT